MKRLTKSKEKITQVFWKQEPSTVSILIEQANPPKPPHSGISSIARILEKKEFVNR